MALVLDTEFHIPRWVSGLGIAIGAWLVVIGGCSHAGIINTVKYAQKVTGTPKVHAVLGGFHLTGPLMEPVIGPT
jgi:7,8-dihydropterin-6-yl-methyl-4-(beta-D-ribofuranosyl)aminobenzene 5'-phosphate synthase